MSTAQTVWLAVSIWGVLNCLTFIIGYQAKTRGSWRHYPMGRHLMGFIVALLVPFTLLALDLLAYRFTPWAWIIALTGVNVVLTQRLWLLFTQRWRSQGSDASEDTLTEQRRG